MEFIATATVLLVFSAAVLLLAALVAMFVRMCGGNAGLTFRRGLWFLSVVPAGYLYGLLAERNCTAVKAVEIPSPRLPKAFDGYRIVQISDLHLMSFRNRENVLKKMMEKVNGLNADLIVFTGDIVTESPAELSGFENILSGIHAADGIYSVLGNHDYCIYNPDVCEEDRPAAVNRIVGIQEKMGWNVLRNENVRIYRHVQDTVCHITLAGIENSSASVHFPSYGDLDKAMAGTDSGFTVMLNHDPTYWEEILSRYPETDLTLSGHTHAMQISIFGFSPSSLLFKHYRGLYSCAGRHLYVNIGLGETAIMSRVGAPPEITVLTLRSE